MTGMVSFHEMSGAAMNALAQLFQDRSLGSALTGPGVLKALPVVTAEVGWEMQIATCKAILEKQQHEVPTASSRQVEVL